MHDPVDNAECPGCGARSTLDPELEYLGARSCGACAGWFLDRDASYRLFVVELRHSSDEIAGLLALPGARKRRCPACDNETSAIVLHGEELDLCPTCGSSWLAPGMMARLTGGAHGVAQEARPAPAQRPPNPFGAPPSSRPANPFGPPPTSAPHPASPRATSAPHPASPPASSAPHPVTPQPVTPSEPVTPPPVEAAAPPVTAPATTLPAPVESGPSPRARRLLRVGKSAPRGALTTSAAAEAAPQGTAAPSASRGKMALVAGGLLAAVVMLGLGVFALSGGDEVEVQQASAQPEDATKKYAAYLRHYRFGGRNVDWWSERLTELSAGGAAPDEKTFRITKQRAEQHGLVVTEQPGRVDVTLSEPLVARLLERLEIE